MLVQHHCAEMLLALLVVAWVPLAVGLGNSKGPAPISVLAGQKWYVNANSLDSRVYDLASSLRADGLAGRVMMETGRRFL